MAESKEAQKRRIMYALNCSEEEAEDVMKWDKVIDQGGRTPYDLDPKAEKEAKKLANCKDRKKPTSYNWDKRERKENVTKAGVIATLAEFLKDAETLSAESVEVTNKERQITFKIGDENYELTLVQKRKKKEGKEG